MLEGWWASKTQPRPAFNRDGSSIVAIRRQDSGREGRWQTVEAGTKIRRRSQPMESNGGFKDE